MWAPMCFSGSCSLLWPLACCTQKDISFLSSLLSLVPQELQSCLEQPDPGAAVPTGAVWNSFFFFPCFLPLGATCSIPLCAFRGLYFANFLAFPLGAVCPASQFLFVPPCPLTIPLLVLLRKCLSGSIFYTLRDPITWAKFSVSSGLLHLKGPLY